MAGLFNRRRRSDSYQGFSKYAYEINAYHNPTQQHGLPIQSQTPQRTASMTSAGQAAAAALRMHSTPVKQQQQQQQQSHARPQQPTAQRYHTARSNSLTTGRSNSLRSYTYNPKPSYSVGNTNGRSYSLSSRNSFTGRPGVTSPLQHEFIHEEGIAGDEEDEEEEVITTKTTRVVDSAGRTTSITTKTIRTLPDGSNIIETTTKNISRPSSRLNSLSSGGNTHRGAPAAAVAGADGNLDMIEEFENFEYSRSELDTELAGTEKLKLNTEDVPASPKQLGAAFSPTQHYERTTSLNSVGKPRSILKNSGASIKSSQPEPVVSNGTAHPQHDSPPSSIRFNPKVQTRQYSPKGTQVKVKKEKLTDEELYAAAYRAANKKVFGDGANVVEPPAPAPAPQSPESAKKSKYTFIPLTRKEPAQPTTPSPTIDQKSAVAAPVPVAASAPAPATAAAPTTETPKSPNYLLSMRDQPQRQTSRKERAKEEKRQAKARAKEAEEEERRRAKEEAEEEKRRAKEEAKLAKQQAEDEKKRLKEEAKLAKEQEKASKKKNNFLDKFINSRRRSSASSYSGTAIENRASVENGGGAAAAAVAVPAAVVTGTAATVSAATPTVQAPTVQAPSLQAPSVQPASIQAPTAQAPSVQVPSVQPASAQAPSFKAPVVQAPSVQAPVVDKPSATAVETPAVQATSVPQPSLEDGVHDHAEGSKTVKGHGKFFSITGAANGNGQLKEASQSEVAVPNGNHSAQAPVQKTVPAQATTVAKDTLPKSSTAPTHLAGIPINSPIYYAADDEANGSSAPAPVSAPKHVADEDSVVKVAVPVSKSRTPSSNNVITGETPIPHVPVPHLQSLDDVTVDVEPETIDDESLEDNDAIDVIDDYRSSLEQRAEEPAVNGSAPAIKAPAQPFANGNVTTPANPQTPSQDLPAPNVPSTSTGNTPQITAVPVMGAAAINTHKADPVPQPQLDTLPDPNVASEDTEGLVVEKKEKGTKRQRFLKFFVL